MTALMTPRDPFTDEDVRKALDEIEPAWRKHGHAMQDFEHKRAHAALLAGTERLLAQGTWNEAIEAAAKYHDGRAAELRKRLYDMKPHRLNNGTMTKANWHSSAAKQLRALKRPEAP